MISWRQIMGCADKRTWRLQLTFVTHRSRSHGYPASLQLFSSSPAISSPWKCRDNIGILLGTLIQCRPVKDVWLLCLKQRHDTLLIILCQRKPLQPLSLCLKDYCEALQVSARLISCLVVEQCLHVCYSSVWPCDPALLHPVSTTIYLHNPLLQ